MCKHPRLTTSERNSAIESANLVRLRHTRINWPISNLFRQFRIVSFLVYKYYLRHHALLYNTCEEILYLRRYMLLKKKEKKNIQIVTVTRSLAFNASNIYTQNRYIRSFIFLIAD
jgi:hypothetical protein